MLGQLARQQEPDSSLDLARSDGRPDTVMHHLKQLVHIALPLVVVGEFAGLCCDSFEEVVDEGIHDAHSLGGYASIWVDLLQHLQRQR